MKTSYFLEELARFGWQVSRDGHKHLILQNVLIQADRPLAIRRQDVKNIDPIAMVIQCRQAGLIWDQRSCRARINPNHPYGARYLAALGLENQLR